MRRQHTVPTPLTRRPGRRIYHTTYVHVLSNSLFLHVYTHAPTCTHICTPAKCVLTHVHTPILAALRPQDRPVNRSNLDRHADMQPRWMAMQTRRRDTRVTKLTTMMHAGRRLATQARRPDRYNRPDRHIRTAMLRWAGTSTGHIDMS